MSNDSETPEFYVGPYHVWLGADGIVRQTAMPDIDYKTTTSDRKAGKAVLEATAILGQGKRVPVLLDIRHLKAFSSDRETRVYVKKQEGHNIMLALAVLVDSPVSTMIGRYFISINKPTFPAQLFTSEDEAIRWLKNLMDTAG